MSYASRHIDILECDISSSSDRSFLSINWDTVNKKYVLGIRIHYAGKYSAYETIYLNFEIVSLLFQRLPEVISLLNKFSNLHIKPVPNYETALGVSRAALTTQDSVNWSACESELDNA